MKKLLLQFCLFILSKTMLAQWTETNLNTGTIKKLSVKGNTIVAGKFVSFSDSGKVYISQDNGLTWTNNLTFQGNISTIVSDSAKFYLGAYSSGLYSSSDMGVSWLPMNCTSSNIHSFATNGLKLFAGTDMSLSISNNYGLNWATAPVNMYEVLAISSKRNFVLAGSHSAGVFLSTNKGTTWSPKGLTGADIFSTAIIDSTLLSILQGTLYISMDLGDTWVSQNLNTSSNSLFVMDSTIYLTTQNGVYISLDKGTNWSAINDGLPNNTNVLSISANDSIVYIGTSNSGVWKRAVNNIQTTLINIKENSGSMIISPNPTNSTFQISNTQNIKNISIKNMLGCEVFQTSNISKSVVDIDINDYSAGVYFVELQSDNGTITKKIVKQ
jgi:hypothetical protein